MGLSVAVLLAALVLAMLWRFARLDRVALQLVGAAVFFALAGYAWQGRPSLEGQTGHARPSGGNTDSEFARTREAVLGRFDRASQWLIIADSYQRRGNSQNAVGVLNAAVRRNPGDSDLWTGLGYMLVLHSDGVITPAAELAFAQASSLAPDAPGPKFYFGLALAQAGRLAEAERLWGPLLASAPEAAEWRPLLASRLDIVRRLRAAFEQRGRPANP